MFDLDQRRPVWLALSRLFVDGDLDHKRLRAIARELERSPYSAETLRHIYEREVAPVCYTHLFEARARPEQVELGWLEEAIVARLKRRSGVPGWWPFGKMPARLGVEMTRSQWETVLRLVGRLRRDPEQLAATLEGCVDTATLVRTLDNLELLGRRARVARDSVRRALGHRDFRVRAAAVEAAASVLGQEALGDILVHLGDDSPTVKTAAITGLDRIVAEIVDPLPSGADGSVVPTRADRVLSGIAERALTAVCAHLRAGKSNDRLHAARVIKHLGPHAGPAQSALFDCFGDRNEAVRRAVAEALVAIDPDPKATFGRLIEGLFEGSRRVRQTAALCLGSFLAAGDPHYSAALTALQYALDDDSAPVRRGAAAALGWMGPTAAQAAPALAALVRAPDPTTRSAALFALGRMEDAALEELPSLAAGLDDNHPEVRRAALRAFQRLGPMVRALQPQFERMLTDPDWLTQFEARRTLDAVRGGSLPEPPRYSPRLFR